ncbi:sensor domain-containing protein [Nocardia sp. NPDC050406]|uniref:sensor domain-containing protein n=1 Tax=Nocardia sp. NPDC050406 TaxID=3364318 RepID=UPI00379C919A
MTVPDSPGRRRLPRPRRAPAVLGIAVLGGVLAACSTTVSGQPQASQIPQPVATGDNSELARLLPNPSQFPSPYLAITLPPETAGQAARDLDGILPGAQVDPGDCMPTPPVSDPAVSVGTDDSTRATLTVELVRTDQTLSAVEQQAQRCGSVRVTQSGTTATVTTEVLPPPPLDADETVALRRTVRSETGGPGLTRTMQTLLGQVGDVRINVTYMSFGDDKPDGEALDSLFTTAVSKVRKG